MVKSLLGAALGYAQAGIPVMPLHTPVPGGGCFCRERDECGSPGKHPRLRHGLHEASTDARLIQSWWRRWPRANIGLATGTTLDVCDVDTNAGLRAVLDLLDVVRPAGPLVRTGLGYHLWFGPTGYGSRIGLLPGVDWRGRGGAAVAPPSLHSTGHRYVFTQPWDGGTLPQCPPALARLVVPPAPVLALGAEPIADLDRYAQAALDGEVGRILAAPRPVFRGGQRVTGGGRNNAVNRAAFRLGQLDASGALDEAVVWPRLTDAAVSVGLSQAEARRTIASGWRAGLRRPRR
ncbi:bifunctional DNA primase/polymerase [Micromonospora sp. CA-248212]|uniref:bifunctional DNA primase/polymerase n=1 Tax=Micromonospora sp. CA-248212 TaxID=3239961 RepID=UPI003D91D928